MLIGVVWVSVTVEIMNRWQAEAIDVKYEIRRCSKEQHAELVEEIRVKIERIRYDQSCESCVEEDRQFPLVRVGE